MSWTISTDALKHTAANNYNCGRRGCPCQSAGITDVNVASAHTWALKPGSTSCAWCNAEAGRPQGNGSHGICRRHANLLIAQAKARKEKKEA